MTGWLADTLVWTGALIALVLVLRRPVARWCGPQVAYALWALPLARLALPPLVLPAWLAPAAPLAGGEPSRVLAAQLPALVTPSVAVPWQDMVLAAWLAGAVILLVWRVQQYHAMRADLLADARPVGQVGRVRLVETPAVAAPVAFGVRDKVVALPPLFMAQGDVAARDLAIAHELAHHRGHDLLANMLAQPLLALHWFNPLAWLGWRAMRRDQEAACDARVVAGCEPARRADYAQVIAGFARGHRIDMALAAPMACPVLGEKSIIHRLRSLTRSDVSAARRFGGLGAIAAAALVVLPQTASISFAAGAVPAVPTAMPVVARLHADPAPLAVPEQPAAVAAQPAEQAVAVVTPAAAPVEEQPAVALAELAPPAVVSDKPTSMAIANTASDKPVADVAVVRLTVSTPVLYDDGSGHLRLGRLVLTRDVPAVIEARANPAET